VTEFARSHPSLSNRAHTFGLRNRCTHDQQWATDQIAALQALTIASLIMAKLDKTGCR